MASIRPGSTSARALGSFFIAGMKGTTGIFCLIPCRPFIRSARLPCPAAKVRRISSRSVNENVKRSFRIILLYFLSLASMNWMEALYSSISDEWLTHRSANNSTGPRHKGGVFCCKGIYTLARKLLICILVLKCGENVFTYLTG